MPATKAAAVDSIRAVLERCGNAELNGRCSDLAECFAVGAVLEVDGRRLRGRSEIHRGYEHLRTRPQVAGTPTWPLVNRTVTGVEVQLISGTEAHVVSEFVASSPYGEDHRGHVVDRLRLQADAWVIVHRRVVVSAAAGNSSARTELRRGKRQPAGPSRRPAVAGPSAILRTRGRFAS